MRKIAIAVFLSAVGLIIIFPQKTGADNSHELTVSDAVYADLALNSNLDNVSIYSFNGNNIDTVSVNPLRQWLPASTVKLYVAMYAFDQISKGNIRLDDTYTIDGKNAVPTELVTDEMPTIGEGSDVTLQRLLKQMITQSDNTAYNTLLDILDRQKITEYIKGLGITHTNIGSKLNLDTTQGESEYSVFGYGINTTTAEDYARAFVLIEKNEISAAKDLYSILIKQKINNMIPLFLPKNTVIAHKTGDLDPLYHDGGIINSPSGPYVLSVFSNLGDPNYVAHLSELIYTKNYDLVGVRVQNIQQESLINPPIDPLVLNPEQNKAVLAASTLNFQPPEITAADLGIKAKDLSLIKNSNQLPKVLIPADSSFHFLVKSYYLLRKGFSTNNTEIAKIDADYSALQLSEAIDLLKRGKNDLANSTLRESQNQLYQTAKNRATAANVEIQTEIQANSETRFKILGNELKNSSRAEKVKLIKEIATQARDMVVNVQPLIPKAINTTNPNQKPLMGEVISSTTKSMTLKTSGGQTVTVPVSNNLVVRSKESTQSFAFSSINKGTTVALIGSYVGSSFTPSFVLTDVPRQWIAPKPVTVVKVDTKNKTIIVSDNGIPIQINVNAKTVIKGENTNISLNSVKTGEAVVVQGEVLKTSVTAVKPLAKPSPLLLPSPSAQPSSSLNPALAAPVNLPNKPASSQTPTISKEKVKNQPEVLQGVTIKVIGNNEKTEKHELKAPESEKKHITTSPLPIQNKKQ